MALPSVEIRALQADLIDRRAPTSAIWRRYYGRGVDLAAIESAVRSAEVGLMADLCDLETETMQIDPHLSGILAKRFGSLEMLPWRVEPAEGEDLDQDLAREIANVVKRTLQRLPFLQERFYDLAWGIFDGRAALELSWERVAGGDLKWAPTEARWIHPRNLAFGPERELRYVDAWQARGYFAADGLALRDYPGKFITWTPRLFREYQEREGLGPRCLYWSFFKRFSWRMRMLLTELFGVPWRIVKSRDASGPMMANADELVASGKQAEALGAETTAVLTPGVDLEIVQGEGKGELFSMTSEQVDAQMSKLVLGQVGTTDGATAGMNSNTVGVMKGEQDILKQRDAAGLGGRVKSDLAYYVVLVNYGEEAAALYTPKVVLDASPGRDRRSEMDLAERAAKLKVPVAQKQVREIAGLREPEPDEPLVEVAAPPSPFGAPLPGMGQASDSEDAGSEDDSEDEEDPKDATEKGASKKGAKDEGKELARRLWAASLRAMERAR